MIVGSNVILKTGYRVRNEDNTVTLNTGTKHGCKVERIYKSGRKIHWVKLLMPDGSLCIAARAATR